VSGEEVAWDKVSQDESVLGVSTCDMTRYETICRWD
jgi:hypothetical protein